jgi:hypothetical protein
MNNVCKNKLVSGPGLRGPVGAGFVRPQRDGKNKSGHDGHHHFRGRHSGNVQPGDRVDLAGKNQGYQMGRKLWG